MIYISVSYRLTVLLWRGPLFLCRWCVIVSRELTLEWGLIAHWLIDHKLPSLGRIELVRGGQCRHCRKEMNVWETLYIVVGTHTDKSTLTSLSQSVWMCEVLNLGLGTAFRYFVLSVFHCSSDQKPWRLLACTRTHTHTQGHCKDNATRQLRITVCKCVQADRVYIKSHCLTNKCLFNVWMTSATFVSLCWFDH